ncbi:hypothetical protein R5R35_002377 [Gryllus longicercus]|uniref:Uncharacterized protein n=1 Tax=Gryllus longicercus TaxID=2509291 RepID=A0AAN9VF82_9ORTH
MPRQRRYNTRRASQLQRIRSTPFTVLRDLSFLPRLRSQARRIARSVASEIETTEEASSSSSATVDPSNSESSIDWGSSEDSMSESNVEHVGPGEAVLRLPAHLRESAFFSDGSDDEFFEGFGDEDDDNDIGMDRIAEVIVYLESGDRPNYDGTATNSRDQVDDFLSDDEDIPDDPFQRELRGSMPEPRMSLHAAALRGNTKELRRWKNWRISLNGGKAQEDTPLHCAARAGDVGTVEELIEQGASISATNMFHHSPLEIAARYGHTAVVKTLLEHGAGEDPDEIERAYEATKSWAVVKTLTSHDDVFLENLSPEQVHLDAPWVNQMLFRVVQQGRVNILRGLLNMGANANCNGILGWTPLQIAVRRCHIRCVSALLEGGADVNGRDDFMWTALHYAARDGHHDIALLLLKAGADVLARCRTGRTPIAVSTDEATRHLLQNYNDS